MIKIFDVAFKTAKPIEAFWGNRVSVEEVERNRFNLTFPEAGLTYLGDVPGHDTIAIFNKEIGTYTTLDVTDFSEVHII